MVDGLETGDIGTGGTERDVSGMKRLRINGLFDFISVMV